MSAPGKRLDRTPWVSRRRLVQGVIAVPVMGAAATALTACGGGDPAPEPIEIEPSEPPEQDETLLDELALIGAYEGTIAVHRELRGSLSTIAEQHRAHARELGATEDDLAAIDPIPPQAANAEEAVANLIKRERRAAEQRAKAAEQAEQTERVRALTFIAASESSHVPELKDIRSGVTNA